MKNHKAVDLFAGWGGMTLGAEQAGTRVVWAANHWQLAVDAHELNHPDTEHSCQDLRQADWTSLPHFDLLMASPCCQGHSQASQPRRRLYHDAQRATAWAVIDCADVTSPSAVLVENVPDFLRWRLYPLWREALKTMGYLVQEHKLRASHFGVPQRRDRLYIVATKRPVTLDLTPTAHELPFGPSIDWNEGHWRPVCDASPRVQERIARGRGNYGARFLTQHVTGHPGVPLDEPIRTVTTRDQWAVVRDDEYRPLTIRENARAMGFPEHYAWPNGARRCDTITGLGNAVCPPVAARIVGQLKEAA